MKYEDFSREKLIERIIELETLNSELLSEKELETRLEYSWSGNLGHWYWNVKNNDVTFNPLKVTNLGYDLSELPENVDYQFFTEMLHPEDYDKTMEAMLNHLQGKANVYEVEYRIRCKDGSYKWYYDRGKITKYDEDGKPLFLAGIVFDITDNKVMQSELEYKNKVLAELSAIDDLTQIANYRTLIKFLESEILTVNRSKKPLSIAIFDIDDFKVINDTKGHIIGNGVLADIAGIINSSIRDTDLAGRYGGEEFMVIFSNANIMTASKVAERIRESIENHTFGEDLKLTLSGGLREYLGEDIDSFINSADMNLLEAKRRGKNLIIA
ncbi:MAG: PAS domain S-box/diguanylate cyclase (GGDEF) domain-containing protein [Fusobacteria bacterium]|nr:MAG: PAS domain S-box/diguanylate cyclase (GGDEF) domain-containing protein [Fusobacteriota bacterium]KAF0228556.1 MAG: PAS domain S-box/diguanylate cyclase (GGDEF) domain-containing [Fusobacteriota bacterium]